MFTLVVFLVSKDNVTKQAVNTQKGKKEDKGKKRDGAKHWVSTNPHASD